MNTERNIQGKRFTYAPNVEINYEEHGKGAEVMLFLHGFGASVETWRDIQADLAKRYTLYFLDLKGFGLSSKPDDENYFIEEQARIVLSFIQFKSLTQVTLVGHSYGGAVSLFTHLLDKDDPADKRISRLILLDAAAYVQEFPFFIEILRRPFVNWIVMNLVHSRVRASFTLKHLFFDGAKVSTERIDRYATFFDQPGTYHSFVTAAKQIVPSNPDSIAAEIRRIDIPTLIVWGQDDPAISVAQGHRLHTDISNSSLVLISNCGHIPHEEKPAETVTALLHFMER